MQNHPVVFSVPAESFPPVFGVDILSILLCKRVSSIHADRCRAPHKLPPSIEIPGAQQPLWLLTDVLEWLSSYRQPPAAVPTLQTATPRKISTGAPTMVERAKAAKIGLTVKQLRASEQKMGEA